MSGYVIEGPTWSSTTVTWSFADLFDPNSSLFSDAIGGNYQIVITAAIAEWQSVSGLTFTEVPDNTPNVDIRFGWTDFGASGQVGVTDYSYTTGATESFLPGVQIGLEDPLQTPVAASLTATYQGTDTTLYQTVLHEVGHALGLGEATDPDAVEYEYLGSSNRDLDQSDADGVHALYGTSNFSMTDTVTGASSHPEGAAYTGATSGVQQQLIYSGADAAAISASTPNVFIQGGTGSDAIAVSSGSNVIDGSLGSNFLVGGTGTDTFYVDGRGASPTWDTLVNFHTGDTLTLWGFDPSSSTMIWTASDGAPGYTGVTLHTDIGAAGISASITFAGMTWSDKAKLVLTTGTQNGASYLNFANSA